MNYENKRIGGIICMYEIKKAILKSVLDEKESTKTLARYDAVYYDVFGEMDKENIEKFNEALRSLEKENRIIIDGDRIDLKNSDILIANDISVICDLEKEDI
jgi:DNA-directed RNA polymerase subunit F